ncbi:MAG: aconitate hydratase, partial [Deltaproteobacteria bacterium]|nr:aconitate hydratase [Deltaproteobacteria bacterium]
MSIARSVIQNHLVEGQPEPGQEVALKIDQTLTQDATGTLAYLEFESLGLDRVKVPTAVSYVDHNLLQTDPKNADDHAFLRTAAARFGVHFSGPGNGICHQVQAERFAAPGLTLLGSDSHTPAAGGLGMLAIGAGGLDVAAAMAGQPFSLTQPRILGVRLRGSLEPWVSGKDVILELLRRLTVKGGVGWIVEYFGPGVASLNVADRLTICHMGAELGATSSIFPSDETTRRFLQAQGRAQDWRELKTGDQDFDRVMELDLTRIEPLLACPSSPDNVAPVRDKAGLEVAQVIVGSSGNSSYHNLMVVARALAGRKVNPAVSFEINPGSRQVLSSLAASGGLAKLIEAGARIHQPGCLGCIGIGQAPASGTVSLRTFPRNFPGRSGTPGDQVYLCSPETAAAAALTGRISPPQSLGDYPRIEEPEHFVINDSGLVRPLDPKEARQVNIVRGPHIGRFPQLEALPGRLEAKIIIKVGDNITTDHILPGGARVLPW